MTLKEKVFLNHMEVELRDGAICIVVAGDLVDICDGNHLGCVHDYTDELLDRTGSEYDIMKATNPFTKEVVFERVDWSKVEVDTKILVKSDTGAWLKRHFAKYEDGKVFAWECGRTSYTGRSVSRWENVKLYKGEGNQ